MQEGQDNNQPASNWSFRQDDSAAPATAQPAPQSGAITEVSWTASEYIAHDKTMVWYIALGLGSVAAAAGIWLLTGDKISATMIVVVAVLFGIFAARQPRVLNYQINHSGVRIGQKFYPYHDFKSFSIVEEGPIDSILLVPLKRFMPGVSMYYPPEEEGKIVNVISNYLPHEERPADPLDNFMRKVRF